MGMFDGPINQLRDIFQNQAMPAFEELKATLEGQATTDAHLDASIQALQRSIDANTAFQAALIQQLQALNAHPAVAQQ